jgi:catechol 2,3-dioxygenase-like lactoylglutathione lyase family enzyme
MTDASVTVVTKESIDVGIVVRHGEAMLGFYRDVLGLEHFQSNPMPLGIAGTMHRVRCGTTVLKLVELTDVPDPANPPGGLLGGTGFRYITFFVADLDALLDRCRSAGTEIAIERTTARPGVDIAMVIDPDGNWVELGQISEV